MDERFKETNSVDALLVVDRHTKLMWQGGYAMSRTWWEALDYARELNAKTYGGYSNWRLPAVAELAALTNYERCNPASDFPCMPQTGSGRPLY